MRGIWRWVDESNGADTWLARVETQPGQWADVHIAEYEHQAYQPPFWQLPLKEDHFSGAMRDPILEEERRIDTEFIQPSIGILAILGALAFLVILVGTAMLVRFE